MPERFDFIVVGGGSAGAVLAARLSEDPSCRVALLEAGERPPDLERIPIVCAALQKQPATDWMYTAHPGGAGLGLRGNRVPVPRGKMLGGSSGLNYMAYVRGHPADFDAWAAGSATGWSYADVLPYFRKSEALAPSDEIVIDRDAHGFAGPMGVSVRAPVLEASRNFVDAAVAAGIPRGDYNGQDRGGAAGVVSLLQTTTRHGMRTSTYRAFLEGSAEQRPNLHIVTGAHATRIVLEGREARGVEYRAASGELRTLIADKEIILSAGSVGSPHLLMLSGIGAPAELERAGVNPAVELPDVGRHLKDHVQVGLFFSAPGLGVSLNQVMQALSPGAMAEWQTSGRGLSSSSLYDAAAWFSTGLGDAHSHDGQIACFTSGGSPELFGCLHINSEMYFDDVAARLAPAAEHIMLLANPVLPHSEGEILLRSADPLVHPDIRMNYFSNPHDMKVMVAVLRRALEIAAHWPNQKLGPLMLPPVLARRHGVSAGGSLSDAVLEDMARHFSMTVYHLTSTCRMGSVVDPRLRVQGVDRLRVADASVMPNVVSGNTNAAAIMIGEKAAEMIARDHGFRLAEFVG